MDKVITHFIILLILFFGMWFLLSKVDFVEIFKVKKIAQDTERKLGSIVLESIKESRDELESKAVKNAVEKIKNRLCEANGINDSTIRLYIIVNNDVNAFALPDRQLVLYTGLISYCKTPEELSGVIAHEITHIQLDHVMQKLTKEVGLAMLTTIAGGEAGGQIARSMIRVLSSTAFDREQEREADEGAVHMMAKSDIDPEHFANFLFRLSQEKFDIPKEFELLSTHPHSKDRSAEILKLRKQEKFTSRVIMSDMEWDKIKKIAKSEQQRDK